jgi:hypothetical protein
MPFGNSISERLPNCVHKQFSLKNLYFFNVGGLFGGKCFLRILLHSNFQARRRIRRQRRPMLRKAFPTTKINLKRSLFWEGCSEVTTFCGSVTFKFSGKKKDPETAPADAPESVPENKDKPEKKPILGGLFGGKCFLRILLYFNFQARRKIQLRRQRLKLSLKLLKILRRSPRKSLFWADCSEVGNHCESATFKFQARRKIRLRKHLKHRLINSNRQKRSPVHKSLKTQNNFTFQNAVSSASSARQKKQKLDDENAVSNSVQTFTNFIAPQFS